MKIDIRFRGLEASEALRDYAIRRIYFHLSRYGHEFTSVTLRIGDVNGANGGGDTRCQISIRGPRFGSSTLDELSADAYSAIDSAAEHIARAVRRQVERARGSRESQSSWRCAS